MNSGALLPQGVHVLERGWLSANNIVFTSGTTAIVDTGYWTHQEQTVSLLKSVLGERVPLQLILNTHLHSDHCGGNAALQARQTQAQTLIPPGNCHHVRQWNPVALTYEPTGQHCPPFRFDGLLQPGTDLQLGHLLWQVHAAPGHDPNSVILFEPTHRVLISADALWENGFGVVFPELEGCNAFKEVEDTLNLIEQLAPRVVVPGHGAVFHDLQPALERARRRLAGFVSTPIKHATHAAKVLVKFKLLEVQRMPLSEFQLWAGNTTYLRTLYSRYFSALSMESWLDQLLIELIRTGAAAIKGSEVVNQ